MYYFYLHKVSGEKGSLRSNDEIFNKVCFDGKQILLWTNRGGGGGRASFVIVLALRRLMNSNHAFFSSIQRDGDDEAEATQGHL